MKYFSKHVFISIFFIFSCTAPNNKTNQKTAESENKYNVAKPKPSWVDERVEKAKQRLPMTILKYLKMLM